MNVIYGELGGTLLFLLEPEAEDLVAVRRAILGARTWGEFFAALPDEYRSQVTEMLAEEDIEVGADEPFDADDIPAYADGTWPVWPGVRALEWMPDDIANEFGQLVGSAISGDSLEIAVDKEEEVVAALNSAGYSCHRNEDAVRMATGY